MTRTSRLRTLTACTLTALLLGGCSAAPSDEKSGSGEKTDPVDPVQPAATVCKDSLGAVEVPGNLTVPRNRTCRLEGTAIGGRVTVNRGASLIATDARFGQGISAHGFDRIELLRGRAEGRPRLWTYETRSTESRVIDFVLSGGRTVNIESGPINGAYYLLGIRGQVTVKGLYLDLGFISCTGNKRTPDVSRISAESVGKLQGQCAGLKNFGQTDF